MKKDGVGSGLVISGFCCCCVVSDFTDKRKITVIVITLQ